MLKMVALFWGLLLAQVSAQIPYVSVSQIETTMKKSVAENILDTKMEEATVKGGIVRVGLVHRKNAEAAALMHQELTEIYQIIEGSGTIVVGGRMENPRPVSDPPNLGPTPSFSGAQVGGVSQKLSPKDVVIVPAGMPHRFIQLDGPISYVIYRFEPATAK
jgi:mannose-6-phosphate isomerase-like protein (cupin superfamily)